MHLIPDKKFSLALLNLFFKMAIMGQFFPEAIRNHNFYHRQDSKFHPHADNKHQPVSYVRISVNCHAQPKCDSAFNYESVELSKKCNRIFMMSFLHLSNSQHFSCKQPLVMRVQMLKEDDVTNQLTQNTRQTNKDGYFSSQLGLSNCCSSK